MPDILDKLNPEQLRAATTTEGYIRVIAGAGSGKTRALTARYAYLVSELGIAPENILCVTFTNRAANEMKSRVRRMLGDDLDLGRIGTIHAFCVQLLREDGHVLHFPKDFIILDTEDQKALLETIFEDMHLTMRDTTIRRAIDEVLETYKMETDAYIGDFFLLDNDALKARFTKAKKRDDEIFMRYVYEQKKCFGLDFNDLINFAAYILEHFPDIRAKWAERLMYVMVDEFQDVSARQYNIVKHLSSFHKNLFIVGDPDQTIYTWRGSHMKLFLDFDKTYPEAETIVLDTNYRSTPQILAAADAVIAHNDLRYPKTMRPDRSDGPRPVYCHAKSEAEEAAFIARTITALTGVGHDLTGESGGEKGKDDAGLPEKAAGAKEPVCRCRDIAILYRAHHQSRALEEAFIKREIPYVIYSGIAFYSRREIRDMVCYLRMLTAGDDAAFMRTVNLPARKIGKKKIAFIREKAEETGKSLYETLKANIDDPVFKGTGAGAYVQAIESVRLEVILQEEAVAAALTQKDEAPSLSDILQMILDRSGYESYLRLQGDQERLDNAAEFKRAVAEASLDPDTTLADFLAKIALFTNMDKEEKADSVRLMTVHTAKGMEFSTVFICGLNEGVFPSRKAVMPEDMDEERRLAFVAMTRAKDRLYLTDSEGVGSEGLFKYPSRFIFEAGLDNLLCLSELDDTLIKRTKQYVSHDEEERRIMRNRFAAGTRVRHKVFGEGTVTAVDTERGFYTIKFDAIATERHIMIKTPLEAIVS